MLGQLCTFSPQINININVFFKPFSVVILSDDFHQILIIVMKYYSKKQHKQQKLPWFEPNNVQ